MMTSACTMTSAWKCASGPTVLTSLHSKLDLPTCLLAFVAIEIAIVLAMAGLDMPQHIHVVTLKAVECTRNGHERPTRFMQREFIISLVALKIEI